MSEPTPCKTEDDCTMPAWCRGRSICGRLEDERMAQQFVDEQLAMPMTIEARKKDREALNKLHPGNRFRLMFGQPLLPQDDQ